MQPISGGFVCFWLQLGVACHLVPHMPEGCVTGWRVCACVPRNAIYVSAMQKWGYSSLVEQSSIDDMVWNLRTWPLDLVDWPTMNSHRTVRGNAAIVSLLSFCSLVLC